MNYKKSCHVTIKKKKFKSSPKNAAGVKRRKQRIANYLRNQQTAPLEEIPLKGTSRFIEILCYTPKSPFLSPHLTGIKTIMSKTRNFAQAAPTRRKPSRSPWPPPGTTCRCPPRRPPARLSAGRSCSIPWGSGWRAGPAR